MRSVSRVSPLPRANFSGCAASDFLLTGGTSASIWSSWTSDLGAYMELESSVRWASLLADGVRGSLHAVRLFFNLLSPFAVHEHHDKELERSGGALGHGTGPWDAITGVVKRGIVDDYSENFVDIDMNARNHAVDGFSCKSFLLKRARRWMDGRTRDSIDVLGTTKRCLRG